MTKRILACLLALSVLCCAKAEETDSLPPAKYLIVQTVGAGAVNTAFTEIFKTYIHELRPNRESNQSFPSRHTSWAFTASTIFSNDLYRISPWLALTPHAIADAVALQRVGSREHFASDVIAGGLTGIFSAELSSVIVRKIYGGKSPFDPEVCNQFSRSLSVTSRAVYHLNGGLCTGFASALSLRLPTSGHWGLAFCIETEACPIKNGRTYAPLWNISAMAGATSHFPTSIPALAVECSMQGGAVRWLGTGDWRKADWGVAVLAQSGLSWQFTKSFAARVAADYRMSTMRTALHSIGITVGSTAYF